MNVLLLFLLSAFALGAWETRRMRSVRVRWLVLFSAIVAFSFISRRVI